MSGAEAGGSLAAELIGFEFGGMVDDFEAGKSFSEAAVGNAEKREHYEFSSRFDLKNHFEIIEL